MAEDKRKVRLLHKASRGFLVTSGLLMVVSTVVLFFYFKGLMQEEVEDELFSTSARIESALKTNHPPYQLPPVVEIVPASELAATVLKDTVIFDPFQEEMEVFRELSTYKTINGSIYRITVRNLVVEYEDILIAIIISYVIILIAVILVQLYFNNAKNKRLWRPFFNNLDRIKNFSLGSEEAIELEESDILEFTDLNKEISTLTNKVMADYRNLKQFTEDVSHEMQTPLSIIQAKIDNIINEDDLNDIQFEHLTSIQKDIQRLTQMNKRLTLLTKIENNQFVNIEKVNITALLEDTIENFREISGNGIEYQKSGDIWVDMDPSLAGILSNNLISNAIKYTCREGQISVLAGKDRLSVINSGEQALKQPEKLYSRFYRETEGVKSTGLGLAIVKRICDHYGFHIHYTFEEGKHHFTIAFG